MSDEHAPYDPDEPTKPKACPHCGETYYITPAVGVADRVMWVCDICDKTWVVVYDPDRA